MPTLTLLRRAVVALAAAAVAVLCLLPTAADAHSLDSSTIAVRIENDGTAEATVSLALETLDEALGTSYADEADVSTYATDVVAYLDEHLTATGSDGTVWGENPLTGAEDAAIAHPWAVVGVLAAGAGAAWLLDRERAGGPEHGSAPTEAGSREGNCVLEVRP